MAENYCRRREIFRAAQAASEILAARLPGVAGRPAVRVVGQANALADLQQ